MKLSIDSFKRFHFKNLFRSSGQTRIKKFGTFGGVFTPDVLTILGVIMYLRLGWVVGNAGFLGAVVIILLAKSVTIRTGLSMSFITEFYVLTGTFEEVLKSAPLGDINLFGLREKLSFEFIRNSTKLTKSSCLFIKDSGQESALV